MEINNSIKIFCERFSLSSQSSGELIFSTSPIDFIHPPDIMVRGELKEFYSHVLMSNSPTIGGDMFLQIFESSQLTMAQLGWRWLGKERIYNENWNANWTVFADRSGDILFSDPLSNGLNRIWGSIQQNHFPISESLADFFEAMVICMNIEEDIFSGNTRNDDMSMKSDVIAAMGDALKKNSTDIHINEFMKFFFS
jgi:hypothetical protein